VANRSIDDAVVQILSKVCRARLVIIATHNANNPILCSAVPRCSSPATPPRASRQRRPAAVLQIAVSSRMHGLSA